MESISSAMLNTFAVSAFGEVYLPALNLQTFEKTDSKTLYRQLFQTYFSQEDMLHVIVGLDSGLLANYVLDNGVPSGSRFIFVELPEVMALLEIELPEEYAEKIWVCSEPELATLLTQYGNNICIAKQRYMLHLSSAAASKRLPEYALLQGEVSQLLEREYFEQRIVFTQKEFVHRQLENICENRWQASLLRGKFNGCTAVVVGGGPSMEQQMAWLQQHRQQLVIFAVSRIAAKMIEQGVTPDIVVNVDPQMFSFDVSRHMMAYQDKFLLINAYHATPAIVGQWGQPRLFTGDRFPWQTTHTNVKTEGPTVTNTAIDVAVMMGFNQLLLIGVDLCFSVDGITHASGTQEAKIGPNLGRICEWVETYKGELAETPIQMLQARDILQHQVASYRDVTVMNLSENAAKIANIPYCANRNIQLPMSAPSLAPFIAELRQQQQDSHTSVTDLKACREEVSNTIKQLQQIVKQTRKALQRCQQAHQSTLSPAALQQLVQQLDRTESLLLKKHRALGELIKFYGYAEFSAFLTSKASDEWTPKQILAMHTRYYQAYAVIAETLENILHRTLARVDSRLAEYDPQVPLATLAQQWQQDKTPGRITFVPHHPDAALLATELKQQYQQMLSVPRQEYLTVLSKVNTEERVFTKICLLDKQQQHHALQQLIHNLAQVKDTSANFSRLYYLSQACLYRDDQPERALAALLEIPTDLHSEYELRYLSQLALRLNKLVLAEQALQRLQQENDNFKPSYAHVLRIQGKNQQALHAYLDYLDKYQQDVLIWLKFAEFMTSVGQTEAAVSAYQHVLGIEADNQTAALRLAELGH